VAPAMISLIGDRYWWLPRWLEWLPRIDIEGRSPAAATEAGAIAAVPDATAAHDSSAGAHDSPAGAPAASTVRRQGLAGAAAGVDLGAGI